jgi:hypothetical protein
MAAKKIFWNWFANTIHLTDKSAAEVPAGFWDFYKYGSRSLTIGIIEPAFPYGPNSFARVDITALALSASISSTLDNATPEAEQTSWTKDTTNMTFSGTLELNTAPMNGFIGSSDSLTAYFQLKITGSEGAEPFRRTVNLKQSATKPATTAPDAIKIYPTLDEVLGMCLPRVLGPGESLVLQDGNSQVLRVIGVRLDGTPQDDNG